MAAQPGVEPVEREIMGAARRQFSICHCEESAGRRSNLGGIDASSGRDCFASLAMTITITHNVPCWLTALLSTVVLVVAIAKAADDAPPVADPPAGQLLIASAEIQDPRFQQAVLLLLHHDKSGAFGVVINLPLGKPPLAALLSAMDGKDNADSTVEGNIRVFLGGPVQPPLGFGIP